ncbi:uncharacterized protein LOC142337128 isoform X2 [Convolutriloba macropyga]|uniref:uncharacterized protein LOC142337128 isoform X2 n=1 Tax=Convolutriloba macropyga TaxID=536237 RepID=UPI003F51F040
MNDSSGKCQLHTRDTLTLDPFSWYNDSSCSPGSVPAEKNMKMYLFQTGSGLTYDCDYLLQKGHISQSGYTTIEVRGNLIAVYCLVAADDSSAVTYMDVTGSSVTDQDLGTINYQKLKLDVNACVLNVNTTDISQSDQPGSDIEIGIVSPCHAFARVQTLDFTLTPFRFVRGWYEQVVVDSASPSEEIPASVSTDWQIISTTYSNGCADKRYILTNLELVRDYAYLPMIPMVFNTR